jgi:cytochrome c biogenesis protein CcdA/glutaredoxin
MTHCWRSGGGARGLALGLLLSVLAAPCLAAAVTVPSMVSEHGSATAGAQVVLVLYTRQGCPRCAAAKAFLELLRRERPDLQVVERPVDSDRAALRELEQRLEALGVTTAGVPTFAVGGRVIVGFDSAETTGKNVRLLLAAQATPAQAATNPNACALDESAPCAAEPARTEEVRSKLFGRLTVSRLGLPLFTIALGLLDGFNPCAMWVLLFLLAMLAGQRDRKRMAVTAGTFVIASGVVYYAFMAAWLNVFLIIGAARGVQAVLGLVALAMGALNIKDFVAFQRGPSLSIPAGAKPGIYARVRQVLRAKTLAASVLGVAVLAVLVNFVELLCTAGFPAVYTSVLAHLELSAWARAGYLGLYNVAYVADDTLVVTLAVLTLSRRRLSERFGRWLKLVSGLVMLGLGVVLLVAPELLA